MKTEQEQAYILPKDTFVEVEKFLDEEGSFTFDQNDEEIVYQYGDRNNLVITDTYYDTPDNDLRLSTVSLRTRLVQDSENPDGKLYVTFKGKEDPDSKFTQDHGELEFEWPTPDFKPEMLTDAAGMVPVQQRITKRANYVIRDGKTRIGEMNLDNSFYTVSTGQARIFEVEIERDPSLKKKEYPLKNIRKALEKSTPVDIKKMRWSHGKFVTGKAVEFAFGVKTDDNDILNPGSFFFIEQMFQQLRPKN